MHGDRLLASPITTMTGVPNGTLNSWSVYLPSPTLGETWSDWNGTHTYTGQSTIDLPYSLQDIPLFIQGGILPMKTMASVSSDFPDPLVWCLFPGARTGFYSLYEDDGNSQAYEGGEYVITPVNFTRTDSSTTLVIAPAQSGEALPPGFPQARSQVLQIRGAQAPPTSVAVNGAAVPAGMGVPGWYISANHTLAEVYGALVVSVGPQSSWSTTTIQVNF